jgi:hypothetical protein
MVVKTFGQILERKKKSVENWGEELPVKAQSVDFDDVENFQEGQNEQTLNLDVFVSGILCFSFNLSLPVEREKKQFRGEKNEERGRWAAWASRKEGWPVRVVTFLGFKETFNLGCWFKLQQICCYLN